MYNPYGINTLMRITETHQAELLREAQIYRLARSNRDMGSSLVDRIAWKLGSWLVLAGCRLQMLAGRPGACSINESWSA